LRKESRLRVFENRLLRRIFGLKRDEVTWQWRKHHNEEHNKYYSDNQIENNKMGGACSTYWESRSVYGVLGGNSERKRSLGRPRHMWGIILRWIFRNWDMGFWTSSRWLRIRTGGGHL
jgi:hypothetical protein